MQADGRTNNVRPFVHVHLVCGWLAGWLEPRVGRSAVRRNVLGALGVCAFCSNWEAVIRVHFRDVGID
jgi:hypothetical protein